MKSLRTPLFCVVSCAAAMVVQFGCNPRNEQNDITIVSAMTAYAWPTYIGIQGGYYKKYGLNAQLLFSNHWSPEQALLPVTLIGLFGVGQIGDGPYIYAKKLINANSHFLSGLPAITIYVSAQ